MGDKDSTARLSREITAYYRKNLAELPQKCRELLKTDVYSLLGCEPAAEVADPPDCVFLWNQHAQVDADRLHDECGDVAPLQPQRRTATDSNPRGGLRVARIERVRRTLVAYAAGGMP